MPIDIIGPKNGHSHCISRNSHAISDLKMSILAIPMSDFAAPLTSDGSSGHVSSTRPVMTSLMALIWLWGAGKNSIYIEDGNPGEEGGGCKGKSSNTNTTTVGALKASSRAFLSLGAPNLTQTPAISSEKSR